jgi:6-carboxyhexanoate--CoA ligase
MRASKKSKAQNTKRREHTARYRVSKSILYDMHISGAEGLYKKSDISRIVNEYLARAVSHARGKPDTIVITLEKLRQKPRTIQSLPVKTITSRSRSASAKLIREILVSTGISNHAIKKAFSVLQKPQTVRGAALVSAISGRRIETDKRKGVRVSRLGISEKANDLLSEKLAEQKINIPTVKEAIILASKVASVQKVIAELCVSDDPDYTIGYVSSRKYGYVRIPHIKRKGDKKGGRVFFVADNADVKRMIYYLEKSAVLINRIAECSGISLHEILDSNNK